VAARVWAAAAAVAAADGGAWGLPPPLLPPPPPPSMLGGLGVVRLVAFAARAPPELVVGAV